MLKPFLIALLCGHFSLWGQLGVFGNVGQFKEASVGVFGPRVVFHKGSWTRVLYQDPILNWYKDTQLEIESSSVYFETRQNLFISEETHLPFGYQGRPVSLTIRGNTSKAIKVGLLNESIPFIGFERTLVEALPFVWSIEGEEELQLAFSISSVADTSFQSNTEFTWVGFTVSGWQEIPSERSESGRLSWKEALVITDYSKVGIVKLLIQNELEIQEAITPNGDSLNDRWHIGNMEAYPTAHIQVFTATGILVYESVTTYQQDWEGHHFKTGKPLPNGTYYYRIRVNGTLLGGPEYKGTLLLKRN